MFTAAFKFWTFKSEKHALLIANMVKGFFILYKIKDFIFLFVTAFGKIPFKGQQLLTQ